MLDRKNMRAVDVCDLVNAIRLVRGLAGPADSDKVFLKGLHALLDEKGGPGRLRKALVLIADWLWSDVYLPVEVKERQVDHGE